MAKFGAVMIAALVCATPILAHAAEKHPIAEAQALEMAKKAITFRSVRGPGNQTPDVWIGVQKGPLSGVIGVQKGPLISMV